MIDIYKQQLQVCKKYGVPYFESPSHLKVGISRNVKEGIWPVNGMRTPVEGGTTGWYIWAGEEFSEVPDFFGPLDVEHLKEWRPEILKYLGFPPGWRFLIGQENYEDVWEDAPL